MELKTKELTILENALNALIGNHENEINEIKSLDDDNYKTRISINKYRGRILTVDDLKQRDIEKELKKIEEVKELKEKLLLSDNYLLVVSNRINLSISEK